MLLGRGKKRAGGTAVNGDLRIVVCDQDPAVNATVAHLLGVAFSTPALFGGQLPRVCVEVLDDYLVDSSLMALVQGEPFAARRFIQRPRAARPTAAVTFTGVRRDTELRSVIDGLGVPVTCLLGIFMTEPNDRTPLERFHCSLDESCTWCVSNLDTSHIDSLMLAEACSDFARLVAEGVTGNELGEQ